VGVASAPSVALSYPLIAYAPLLLERKVNRMRKTMDAEKGSTKVIRTVFDKDNNRTYAFGLSTFRTLI